MPGPSPAVPACTEVASTSPAHWLGVLLERLGQRAVAGPPQLDPVGDLQAAVLAGLLDEADDLADEAGPLELGGEREVQRDGQARPAGHRPALPRRLGDDEVALLERHGAPSTSTLAVPAR